VMRGIRIGRIAGRATIGVAFVINGPLGTVSWRGYATGNN